MTDTEPDQSESSRRRVAQRQRQTRQTRNRIIGAVVAVVLVVLAALWFSDTLRIPTDGPSLAGGAETVKTKRASNPTDSAPDEPVRRPLSPDQPLRLWIGGDSLAGALGPSLGRMTAATGVVQPQYDSRVGSGLISGSIDWPEHAQEQMDELNPEVAVFIIGTNDAIVYDESQEAEYAAKVEEMMKVLVGPGREVYWVNAPVLRDEDDDENVQKVDGIQRAVAATIPEVTFVDAHTLFADENGEYQSSLPDDTGKKVIMRAGDGIHLSGAGGDHLARAILALMDPRWKIVAQAVPGQQKQVRVTRGSTRVGGGSSSSSGSSGSGSGSGSSSWDPDDSDDSSHYQGSGGTTATSVTTPTTMPTEATQPTTAPTVPPTTPTTTAAPPG